MDDWDENNITGVRHRIIEWRATIGSDGCRVYRNGRITIIVRKEASGWRACPPGDFGTRSRKTWDNPADAVRTRCGIAAARAVEQALNGAIIGTQQNY